MTRQTKSRPHLEQRVTKLEASLQAALERPNQRLRTQVNYTPNSLLGHLETLTVETQDLQRKAEADGDYRLVLACVRERAQILELVARLRGELESRAPQNNFLNVNFDLETSRKMLETYFARRRTLEGNHEQH